MGLPEARRYAYRSWSWTIDLRVDGNEPDHEVPAISSRMTKTEVIGTSARLNRMDRASPGRTNRRCGVRDPDFTAGIAELVHQLGRGDEEILVRAAT